MNILRAVLISLLLSLSAAGASLVVPDSELGAVWFTGYVDTVSDSAFDYLLGWDFKLLIEYRLSGWDRVSPFGLITTGEFSGCQHQQLTTNCIDGWFGPPIPVDIVGFGIADGQVTRIDQINGASGIQWFPSSGDRWEGYWSIFTPSRTEATISGPVTSSGIVATPEPVSLLTAFFGLSVWFLSAPFRRARSET